MLSMLHSRCSKVLPIAENSYQEGLPQHYTKTYHVKKVDELLSYRFAAVSIKAYLPTLLYLAVSIVPSGTWATLLW